MKARHLPSLDYLHSVLRLDEDGFLRWRLRPDEHFPAREYALSWNKRHAGNIAGGAKGRGYRMVRVDGVAYLYHRLVYALANSIDPGPLVVDHKDGDTSSSTAGNLQVVSNTDNVRKRRGPGRNNTSGVLGVSWHKASSKWVASIKVNRKKIHLGAFVDLDAAEQAREAASQKHFGAFAPLTHEAEEPC